MRRRREERDWTLDQLAHQMDRNDGGRYLGEIERGYHSPSLTMAKEIADALDVSLAELVEGI
jgi:transcriptional regulator with XRE-family HTH domain